MAFSLAEAFPQTNTSVGLQLVPFREHLFGNVRAPLYVLLAAVGFALLALAVLTVSSLATLVPAIRAPRVDPMEALREG